MTDRHEITNAPIEETGFDRQEVNSKLIGLLALATVAFIIAAIFGVQYYYDRNYERQVYIKVLEPVASDLQNLRAREDRQLHSYEYIDRESGAVRLTIERAMEVLAAEYEAGAVRYPTTPYPVKAEEEAFEEVGSIAAGSLGEAGDE